MPSPPQKLLPVVILFGLGAGCHTSTNISNAEGESGNRNNSSTGLGNLGGGNDKPDSGHVDPPNDIKPFADAGSMDVAVKEQKCAGESQMAKQVPIDLLLLVDRSGSMNSQAGTGMAAKTKWELAQDAVTTFLNDPKSAGLGVGLQYFPLPKACSVDADCGAGFSFSLCNEQKVCAGAAGPTTPLLSCAARPTSCATGSTCQPLGRCSQTGEPCTTLNDVCPGGIAANRCTVVPKTCRDGIVTNCALNDFQKLAVPIGDLPGAAGALTFSVMSTMAGGATPTDPAVQAGVAQLRMRAASNPGRNQALVLVTDGAPNGCDVDPVPLITRMIGEAKMGTPSISTYAIGVFTDKEAEEATKTLTQWSTAGGTGTPFIINPNEDLNKKLLEALNAIRGSALPCEYMIPAPTMGNLDFKKVNVHVTASSTGPMGADIGHVDDATKCDPVKGGWYYDVDPAMGTPTRVVMCEATCKKFKMDATANIELRYGCETVIIP